MIFIYNTWAQCQWGSQIGRIWWWPWQCRSSEESFSCCPGILSQIDWSSQVIELFSEVVNKYLTSVWIQALMVSSWMNISAALAKSTGASAEIIWGGFDEKRLLATSAENNLLSHPHPASLSSLSWPVVVLGAWGPQWTYFLFLGKAEGEKKSQEINLPSVTFGQKLS